MTVIDFPLQGPPRPADLTPASSRTRRAILDIRTFLDDAAARLMPSLGEDIELWVRRPDMPLLVAAARDDLFSALLSLARAAHAALPEGGAVTLSAGRVRAETPRRGWEPDAGDYVAVAIRESGAARLRRDASVQTPDLSRVLRFARRAGGGVRLTGPSDGGVGLEILLPHARRAVGRLH